MHQASDMTLIDDTAHLFQQEPALAALYGFAPQEVGTEAELLAAVLAGLVPDPTARNKVRDLANEAFADDPDALSFALDDLCATAERDLSTDKARVLLFAPGFQGLLSYRVSRGLLCSGRDAAAAAVKALLGRQLSVDIAPEAQIGRRVWLDHGLGVVIGRTAIIEDDVSIWHGVTLGSNFVSMGDRRHPLIGRGRRSGRPFDNLGRDRHWRKCGRRSRRNRDQIGSRGQNRFGAQGHHPRPQTQQLQRFCLGGQNGITWYRPPSCCCARPEQGD